MTGATLERLESEERTRGSRETQEDQGWRESKGSLDFRERVGRWVRRVLRVLEDSQDRLGRKEGWDKASMAPKENREIRAF